MLENKIGPKIVSKTQPNVNLNQLPTQNQIQPQHDEECSGSIATNSTQSENRLPVLVVSYFEYQKLNNRKYLFTLLNTFYYCIFKHSS